MLVNISIMEKAMSRDGDEYGKTKAIMVPNPGEMRDKGVSKVPVFAISVQQPSVQQNIPVINPVPAEEKIPTVTMPQTQVSQAYVAPAYYSFNYDKAAPKDLLIKLYSELMIAAALANHCRTKTTLNIGSRSSNQTVSNSFDNLQSLGKTGDIITKLHGEIDKAKEYPNSINKIIDNHFKSVTTLKDAIRATCDELNKSVIATKHLHLINYDQPSDEKTTTTSFDIPNGAPRVIQTVKDILVILGVDPNLALANQRKQMDAVQQAQNR